MMLDLPWSALLELAGSFFQESRELNSCCRPWYISCFCLLLPLPPSSKRQKTNLICKNLSTECNICLSVRYTINLLCRYNYVLFALHFGRLVYYIHASSNSVIVSLSMHLFVLPRSCINYSTDNHTVFNIHLVVLYISFDSYQGEYK
jgi:hypothetical protein